MLFPKTLAAAETILEKHFRPLFALPFGPPLLESEFQQAAGVGTGGGLERRRGILSIETDIAALQEALNTGATEVYVDGQKVS